MLGFEPKSSLFIAMLYLLSYTGRQAILGPVFGAFSFATELNIYPYPLTSSLVGDTLPRIMTVTLERVIIFIITSHFPLY
jgi:hypothetical protein